MLFSTEVVQLSPPFTNWLELLCTSKAMMDFRLICSSSIGLPRDPPKWEASACQNIALFRSSSHTPLVHRKACQKSLIQINKVRLIWNQIRSSYGNEKKVMLVIITFFQISMMTSSNLDQSDPSPSPSTSSCNSIQWSPSSSLNSEESTDIELPGKKLTVNLLRKHNVRRS